VQHDVEEGRAKLNFSEWQREQEVDDAVETIREGEMPPSIYTIMHRDANLSAAEVQALIDGFIATFGAEHDD
jgi:hypothetical protein